MLEVTFTILNKDSRKYLLFNDFLPTKKNNIHFFCEKVNNLSTPLVTLFFYYNKILSIKIVDY